MYQIFEVTIGDEGYHIDLVEVRKTIRGCKALIEDFREENQWCKRHGEAVPISWYIITDEFGEQVEE